MDNQHHIGIRLRDARKAMGLTQGDVAEALRIKPAYIDAIERLDTAALPSVGYVLGYVRSYAKRVGMNGDEAVAAYKVCLLYTSPSPRDQRGSRMPSSA